MIASGPSRVSGNTLGPDVREQYRQDVSELRKRGQPIQMPQDWLKGRPSGGKRESEQTHRMRVAVEYLRETTQDTPYALLARFWNERLGRKKYHRDEIYRRLAKAKLYFAKTGIDRQLLARVSGLPFWQRVYAGDFREVFIGQFPLHPKLAMRERAFMVGVDVHTLTRELAEHFGAPAGHGVLVRRILTGSRADLAGIRVADLIVEVDGKRIIDSGHLSDILRDNFGRPSVPFSIIREKQSLQAFVDLKAEFDN